MGGLRILNKKPFLSVDGAAENSRQEDQCDYAHEETETTEIRPARLTTRQRRVRRERTALRLEQPKIPETAEPPLAAGALLLGVRRRSRELEKGPLCSACS